DSENTIMHAEESRSKMIAKQNDPQLIEKKVITKPIDYATLNQLSTDFNTRFVPQTESYAEQAFWSQYSVQTDAPTHSGTTIVEVPKELTKVSMVNSCLKKLKYHLASFDIVVKERTTTTAITEGTWGFDHTKACFCDDIIPFVKNLKDLFNSFDQYLIDEVSEVQKTFKQMEMAVEQNCAAKSEFQSKMETVLKENDLLLKHALGVDILNIVVNNCMNVNCLTVDACEQCVTIESELKTDFFKEENYEMLLKQYNTLEKHCISLELNNQLNTEIFQRDNCVSSSENAPNFADLFEINELKAQIQRKDTVILKLKEKIKSLQQCDDLINQVNLKSVEVADLNASLQERVLVITALKDQLKGKAVLSKVVSLNPINPAILQVVQIVLWYLDSGCSKHMTRDRSQLINFVQKFLGTVKFGNDHVAKITGYGDYQIGNVTISRVYYVEGLGHNLFSVGQFCDSDLEVAFRQHTCFIPNLEGVDLLIGSRGNNLYTLSLQDMMASSPISLFSKASKTKSWLWHRRLCVNLKPR
nr:integrase, catalytic region, zinc finger, CCHC-type, peptidase aspartic, catalytic [Tanacetum cinerariifolium]